MVVVAAVAAAVVVVVVAVVVVAMVVAVRVVRMAAVALVTWLSVASEAVVVMVGPKRLEGAGSRRKETAPLGPGPEVRRGAWQNFARGSPLVQSRRGSPTARLRTAHRVVAFCFRGDALRRRVGTRACGRACVCACLVCMQSSACVSVVFG